jgi:glycosyltransferase involved in cell wall biosynthesis
LRNTPRVIIVCNAMDDATRIRRGIVSDSPAASRKVFGLCSALRLAGARPCVLSLGRGRAGRSLAYFRGSVRRVGGIPAVYAPFSELRGLSEALSLLAPIFIVLRLARPGPKAMIFYNRQLAYVPALLCATLLGYRRLLDVEDGEVPSGRAGVRAWVAAQVHRLFDRLCDSGALLACRALQSSTSVRPVHCYYGTAEPFAQRAPWRDAEVHALLGGTLAPDTGAGTLVEAIRLLRLAQPRLARKLHLEITGKGPTLDALTTLAIDGQFPRVTVHGRMTDQEYRAVVSRCQIGLALKPVNGPLAQTTFPSKVVELASAGLLVITTDISDVREVLGDGAVYLRRDDPKELVEALRRAVEKPAEAQAIAVRGLESVWRRCAPATAGKEVFGFCFGAAG